MTSAPDMDDQSFEHPKLRLIDFRPLMYEGEAYIALHDPLMLSEKTLLSPQPFIPLLGLCDGTRSVAGLRTSLAIRYGISLTTERINEFLAVLDEAFLLDNQRSRQARAEASIEFRRAPFRPLSSAGQSYPENADDLARMLAQYSTPPNRESDNDIRGLVSPHIDYNRGGPVYAQAWSGAAQAARNADLAIIFGTDHFSEGFPFSLTRQSYATPFGILPTDTHIVDLLAEVIGVGPAYAGELHHRGEHSIELAANWLHYIRSGKPISTVPVLTGSIEPLIEQGNGQLVDAVLEVLSMAMKNHHVLVIAAAIWLTWDLPLIRPRSIQKC